MVQIFTVAVVGITAVTGLAAAAVASQTGRVETAAQAMRLFEPLWIITTAAYAASALAFWLFGLAPVWRAVPAVLLLLAAGYLATRLVLALIERATASASGQFALLLPFNVFMLGPMLFRGRLVSPAMAHLQHDRDRRHAALCPPGAARHRIRLAAGRDRAHLVRRTADDHGGHRSRPHRPRRSSGGSDQRRHLPRHLGKLGSVRYNRAAFAAPALGTYGNMGFFSVPGISTWGLDAALSRQFSIGDSRQVELRLEAFNVTNAVRANDPVASITSANFGRITSVQEPRIVQFAPRYGFQPWQGLRAAPVQRRGVEQGTESRNSRGIPRRVTRVPPLWDMVTSR